MDVPTLVHSYGYAAVFVGSLRRAPAASSECHGASHGRLDIAAAS
jgi:hypothetical protein